MERLVEANAFDGRRGKHTQQHLGTPGTTKDDLATPMINLMIPETPRSDEGLLDVEVSLQISSRIKIHCILLLFTITKNICK